MDSFDLLKKLFPKKKKITKQPESISFNKIENLDDLLNEIKLNNPLPAPLPDKIYSALKVIANTPDWKKQLDKETKKNLETIFFKWQKQLNKTNADLSTTSAAYGFDESEQELIGEFESTGTKTIIYEHDLETGEFDLYEKYTSEVLKDSSSDVQVELIKMGMESDDNNQICLSRADDVINISIKAKKELLENYSNFSEYDWLRQIEEEDKLNLLKDIYDTFNFPAIPQFFYEKYFKYNKGLIEKIYIKEKNRLNIRIKAYYIYKKRHNTQENLSNKEEVWFGIKIPGSKKGLTGQGKYLNNYCIEFDYLLYLNLTNDFDCYNSNGELVIPDIYSVKNKVSSFPIGLLYNGMVILILNEKEFLNYKKQFNFSLNLISEI